MIDIEALHSARVDGSRHMRDRAVPEEYQIEGSETRYDATTLWYDAIQTGNRVELICPRLRNFAALVRGGQWKINGNPVASPRIRNFYRHSIVRLNCPDVAETVTVETEGMHLTSGVAQVDTGRFAGRNVEMLISKDNDLEWIHDKLRNHVRHHGLEGVLFFDNASTAYSHEEIGKAIKDAGVGAALLVPADYPWGPLNKRRRHSELYLQTSVYNVARIRWLSTARAVMRMDVDETLTPPPEGQPSVFDCAANSRFGYVQFDGLMRFPARTKEPPFQFADHVWRRGDDPEGGGNWCVVPGGPLKRFQWRCHNLERFPLQFATKMKGHWYYDCQGITTGWKDAKRFRPDEELILDPQASAFFAEDGPFAT